MDNLRFCLIALLCGVLVLPFSVWAERTPESRVVLEFPASRRTVHTDATTVASVLRDQGLDPDQFRRVFPALDSPLVQDMHIFLYPRDHPAEGVSRVVSPSEQVLLSGALPEGQTLVIQGGKNGERRGTRLTRDPSNRLILKGYSNRKSRQLEALQHEREMTLMATAYSPHRLDTAPYDDGYSALGLPAGFGVAAVDPRVIPLGTRLYVEGYGYAVAADVGGDIEGKRIDLCFNKRENALKFGRRRVTVYILG